MQVCSAAAGGGRSAETEVHNCDFIGLNTAGSAPWPVAVSPSTLVAGALGRHVGSTTWHPIGPMHASPARAQKPRPGTAANHPKNLVLRWLALFEFPPSPSPSTNIFTGLAYDGIIP